MNVREKKAAGASGDRGGRKAGAFPVDIDAVVVNAKIVGSLVDEGVDLCEL